MESKDDSSKNFVPQWDGKPETFSHFIVECKWALQSSKVSDRPLLAARIVRRALQSPHSAIVQLMYKLRPEEFRSEKDVSKLIKYLEESPLNRQPLPDAGSKIGGYYRRLHRKGHESVNSFLIREDKTHDDMLRALQRLLRDKELDFEGYDMDLEQLRSFCGFKPGASVYYGDDGDGEETEQEGQTDGESRTETPRGSQGRPFSTSKGSGKSSSGKTSSAASASEDAVDHRRGKDILERLMEKGLMPLAALDVIRGWLLLEMTVSNEEERRLIKAATRNKLSYAEIRSALLAMFEDRGGGKGKNFNQRHLYYQEFEPEHVEQYDEAFYYEGGYPESDYAYYEEYDQYQADWGDSWEEHGEEEQWQEDPMEDETVLRLQEEVEEIQKQKSELDSMLAETDRNLVEARKAVAAAAKDRGWAGTVQQKQPRATSTFPFKGKSKAPKGAGSKGAPKGKYGPPMDHHWINKGKGKGKSGFHKGKFGGKGKSGGFGSHSNYYTCNAFDIEDEDLWFNPASEEPSSSTSERKMSATESLVDTGATATAGGKKAVSDLCKAVVAARPDVKLDVFPSARPWFRFGNGRWGRALYKVTLRDLTTKTSVSLYALPAVGIPVLMGMRELNDLQAILNCPTGRCLIMGNPVTLERNHKNHLIVDFLKHVFVPTVSQQQHEPNTVLSRTSTKDRTGTNNTTRRVSFSPSSYVEESHCLELFPFEISLSCEAEGEKSQVREVSLQDHGLVMEHMGIDPRQLAFLLGQLPAEGTGDLDCPSTPSCDPHGGRVFPQGRHSSDRPRGSSRRTSSKPGETSGQGQEQSWQAQDRVRLHEEGRRIQDRSTVVEDNMALLRSSSGQDRSQPVRAVGRVCPVRHEDELHTSCECTCTSDSHRSPDQCGRSSQPPSYQWLGGERDLGHPGEGYDHCGGQGVPADQAKGSERISQRQQGRSERQERGSWGKAKSRDQEEEEGCNWARHYGGSQQLGGAISREGELATGRPMTNYDGEPLGEATRQQLLASTTEFNVGSTVRALQDFAKPFLCWEVCCRANSLLTSTLQREGLAADRKTLDTGYDLDKKDHIQRLEEEAWERTPSKAWFSLVCTAVTLIQNLNQRDYKQVEDLRKKRQKCRKQLRGAIAIIWAILQASSGASHFYFEWPKNAYHGWQLPEMRLFIQQFEKIYGKLYFVQIDGCMHGMVSPDQWPIQKSWQIMTNDKEFADRCYLKCDGTHQHRPGGMVGMGSSAVHQTGFYPPSMVNAIVKCWKSQLHRGNHFNMKEISMALQLMEKVEIYALEDEQVPKSDEVTADDEVSQSNAVAKNKQVLKNKRYIPDKKQQDHAWSLLHRLHRAAGHPANRALARLCQDRGMPPWLVQMAQDLRCQACEETKKGGQMTLPVSVGDKPVPWQVLGLDVFELVFQKQKTKARFLLMTCLVMRLTSVQLLWQGDINQIGTDSGEKMVHAFTEGWLLHRPRPEWCLVDPQTGLSKGAFPSFCHSAGIGVAVTPGEAHWQHGATESMVKSIKATMRRIRNERPQLAPKLVGALASLAENHTDKVKGYTPVQWAYGSDCSQWHAENDPLEVNKQHSLSTSEFWQLQRNRERAEQIHREELAKQRIVRLNNAAPRPTSAYAVGDWVCVWRKSTIRAKRKAEDPEPRFLGPGRVAMIEPAVMFEGKASVIWVLMGTSVWRCAPEQLRPATEQEIVMETIKLGDTISLPMTDLIRRLHSTVDVTKEPRFDPEQDLLPEDPAPAGAASSSHNLASQPSTPQEAEERQKRVHEEVDRWNQLGSINKARRTEGLSPLTTLPQHLQQDVWEHRVEEGKLIRHHRQARWTMFVPSESNDCPVELRDILGDRVTQWWDGKTGGNYRDDWKKCVEPRHAFAHEWKGHTEFKVRRPMKKRKEPERYSIAQDSDADMEGKAEADDEAEDSLNMTYLNQFSTQPSSQDPTSFSTSTSFPTQSQHSSSPHQLYQLPLEPELDEETQEAILMKIQQLESVLQHEKEEQFRQEIDEAADSEKQFLNVMMTSTEVIGADEACFVEFTIDNMKSFVADHYAYVNEMLKGPSKEVNFRRLEPHHQKLMQEAMAREVSEVLRSQTLRALSDEVPEQVLKERCLPMRWILTWKPLSDYEAPPADPREPTVLREDGLAKAKARVVLIGYKHPDLARRDARTGQPQLKTSSPTLSRLGRQHLLQAAALDEHSIESADAKSAFLQADEGIGTEEIYTKGVPELSHALGISPGEAMQVTGAIYGLTNAPRIFWRDADAKMRKIGGVPHALDKCIWLFFSSSGEVCGRVGSHVDDFLIAGNSANKEWMAYRQKIKDMYKWSPWQAGSFTFAGVELKQTRDFNIYLTQETFCNALRPITIEGEGTRPLLDSLSPSEVSQCRGLAMKAQWRAIQSAPQYCARIGLLSSSLSSPTVKDLREAIMRELRKTAKEDMVFHAFNYGRAVRLKWNELIGLRFGDAGLNNRPCGGSTGGYVTGFADPSILQGVEAKVTILDWRSWRLDRPSKGSNGAEGQAIYDTEDKGWKNRLFWAILNGEKLTRSNSNELASKMESLLIMDSRGCYDAITTSDSVLLGMNNARTGVEMLHVQRGTNDASRCYPTWVPGDMNLADSLTKATYESFKVMALYHTKKSWVVRFNQEFVSARKQQRLRRAKELENSKTMTPVFRTWPEESLDALQDSLFGLEDAFPSRC